MQGCGTEQSEPGVAGNRSPIGVDADELRLNVVLTLLVVLLVEQGRPEVDLVSVSVPVGGVGGVCGLAVRRDALRSNPVRDVGNLERGERRSARALTADQARAWLMILDGDSYAVRKDLPDLTRFLLGTGVRIGETLGLRWSDVDLDLGLVSVRSTVVRVKGVGLVAKTPKTAAGVRVLQLPQWLAEVLGRRTRPEGDGPVFPDAQGGYRDRNNVERDYRLVRTGTPFEWVVPHTYRKTVATFLDHGGLSARVVADQLGHARISMTQDDFMGRHVVYPAAASTLEALGADQ